MKLWQKAVGWIVLWRLGLLALAGLAARYIAFVPDFTAQLTLGRLQPYLVWVWGNFDGMIFMLIAGSGYSAEQLPFFPLLPLLIALVESITTLPATYSGLLISALAFLLAQVAIFRLLKLDKQAKNYWLFLAIMLLFPTAHFYTAVYADSLFLALASGALLLARQRRWFLASLCGALAALARLNGLALFFVIGAEYLLSLEPKLAGAWDIPLFLRTLLAGLHPRLIVKRRIFWALLVPAAFLGYLAYIQLQFGDWRLFFTGVEVWHRDKLTFPLQTFWRYFKILFIQPRFTFVYLVALLEAAATGLYILALAWSWGRIRLSYWLMVFLHLLIPTMTGTLQGMPRYGLHLYPLFLIFMLWLKDKPKWVQLAWFAVSLALLAFYVSFYTRGYFVA